MKKLAAVNRDTLIDLLRHRLATGRVALALYERIIGGGVDDVPENGEVREALTGLREQESEHVTFVDGALRSLGAPGALAPVRPELRGFEDVARNPTFGTLELVESLWLHEVVSDAEWQLLHRLARDAEDEHAAPAFERRSREAHAHAVLLRDIVLLVLKEKQKADSARRFAA